MFNTIEEAINDIKEGKVIIVVDDEDRENEGDFLTAASNATPEIINFMATHGRGLICAPLTEERCKELRLDLMVGNNTAVEVLKKNSNIGFSVISIGELLSGFKGGIKEAENRKELESFLDSPRV
ncbi:MAG: 3,4-dihydroxy-2-butanone-4-phosphate synthase, partial [Bacteroidetes bacterium]|nr:3,4-dihydroxy-2-butanone-4-phosphate synthase [Bacteroidota bacterium]